MRKKLEKLACVTAGAAFFAVLARDIALPAIVLAGMAALRQLAFVDWRFVNRGRATA